MKSISLPLAFPKTKIRKKTLTMILIGVLVLAAILGGYFGLRRIDRLPQMREINQGIFLAQLIGERLTEERTEEPLLEEIKPEELEITSPQIGKAYEETAQPGEGITHLARRTLENYLTEREEGLNLSPEHKIYIEDYLQNKIGEKELMVGEKITFSEELIEEAINKAQNLSPEQLENLKKYSVLVPF